MDPADMKASSIIDAGLLEKDENGTYTALGLTEGQVVDVLGENWKDMSLTDIEEKVEAYQKENMSEYDKMQEMLADPTIPASVKQQLQAELASMGASGELASFQEGQQAVDVIDAADQVRVGDKLISTDDLLDDDNIKNDVTNLLADMAQATKDGASTQELLDKFAETYGDDFAQMAKEEFEDLSTNAESMDDVLSQVQNVQKSNEEILAGEGFDLGAEFEAEGEKLMAALGFKQDGPFGQAIDPESSEQFGWIKNLKDNDPRYGKFMKEFSLLDEETLAGLDVTSPDDFDRLVDMMTTSKGIKMAKHMAGVDDVLKAIGPSSSFEDIAAAFPKGSFLSSLQDDPDKMNRRIETLKMLGGSHAKLAKTLEAMSKSPQAAAAILRKKMNLNDEGNTDLNTLLKSGGLFDMLNMQDGDIDKVIVAKQEAREAEVKSFKQHTESAKKRASEIEAKNPWMKNGATDVGSAYKSHPSRKTWSKTFDPGKMGPGTAQKAGAQIFTALTSDPKLFDSMPNVPRSGDNIGMTSELKNWWKKNIGIPNPGGNHARQIKSMIRNLSNKGDGDFKAGLKNIFGKDVSSAVGNMQEYKNQSERGNAKPPANEWNGRTKA